VSHPVRRVAMLLSLLSLPALAANPEVGATAFASACARCHAATQVRPGESTPRADRKNARPGAGPDLGEALVEKGYDPVRSWIQAPLKVRRDATCDTRLLPPAQLDDVMAYLVTRLVPAGPARKERLERSLSEDQAHAAQAGVPTQRVSRSRAKK
jgi:cytochrome c